MEHSILFYSALSIGFIHTLIGPDHYIPFIVMSKARSWGRLKTQFITFLCGMGHVLGSVLLGAAGISLGIALKQLEWVESFRGDLAAWLLIAFGLMYGVWGIRSGLRAVEHTHTHSHNGRTHSHTHSHFGTHSHVHGNEKSLTPWALFIIFILGPCEPLIPLLMYPAAANHWGEVWLVATGFGGVTVLTMMAMVALLSRGIEMIPMNFMERYMHALAGFIIAGSGFAIKFLGL